MEVATEASPGSRLIGGYRVAVQQDVELRGMTGVTGPGLGVLGGLGTALTSSGIYPLLLGDAPGSATPGAVAVGHGVIA